MIELLAPAGDVEKAKIALLYGADAVYIGGTSFSLRARASNFTLEQIKETCQFAHELGKKVYVTTNIVAHDEDMEGLKSYLNALEDCQVDAIIVSSLAILQEALRHTNLEIHLSTQFSVANSALVNYFEQLGVKRVVLARECSIDEIEQIQKSAKADLEVFIHGGMCVSYSGRCTLSNVFSDRDANRGGCAHSCRWKYDLYDGSTKLSQNHDFQFSSKDLETLDYISKLKKIGVKSLKIEGRMKSIHYIATVVSAYRDLLDDLDQDEITDLMPYRKEIQKAENRLTSKGFMDGLPSPTEQLFNMRSEMPTQEFVAIVLDYDEASQTAILQQRNFFLPTDKLELFSPKAKFPSFIPQILRDEEGNLLDAARHPLQKIVIKTTLKMKPYDLIRKVM